jgi:hypothetical protein
MLGNTCKCFLGAWKRGGALGSVTLSVMSPISTGSLLDRAEKKVWSEVHTFYYAFGLEYS